MNEARRKAYLDAMGIEVWIRREPAPLASHAGDGAAVAARSPARTARDEPAPTTPSVEPTPPALSASVEAVPQPVPPPSVAGLDWEALQVRVSACEACSALVASRTQPVFGAGNREADWLIVGEAPGADEERGGAPFLGRAGKLLNNMLLAAGLTREQVYLANVLKCRPPKNRDPQPEEARACGGFLERQIELVRPKLILALGRIAAQTLLQTDAGLDGLRGRVHRLEPSGTALVVSYHPADLLRSPADKRKVWDDLRLALAASETPSGIESRT